LKTANYKYRVEIAYSERDEGYIARVPELGCSA
jgi:predicted RNase H-like HicB family nuclease